MRRIVFLVWDVSAFHFLCGTFSNLLLVLLLWRSAEPASCERERGRDVEAGVWERGRPRSGGGVGASVPDDAGESRSTMGLHSESLFHTHHSAAAHRRRRRRRCLRAPDLSFLRLFRPGVFRLHRYHLTPVHPWVTFPFSWIPCLWRFFHYFLFRLVLWSYRLDILFFFFCFSWRMIDCRGTSAVLFPLRIYYQHHPVNLFLLAIFTVAISIAIGLTCAFTKGKDIQVSLFASFSFFFEATCAKSLFTLVLACYFWSILFLGIPKATQLLGLIGWDVPWINFWSASWYFLKSIDEIVIFWNIARNDYEWIGLL